MGPCGSTAPSLLCASYPGRAGRPDLIFYLIDVVLITGTYYLVAVPLLGIDPAVLPDWAR